MVDDLLDISRIESEKMTFTEEKVEITEAVRHALEIVGTHAESKGIGIRTEIPDEMTAWTDKDKLIRVLVNLLNNAIKFTPANGGHVRIVAEEENEFLKLAVTDQGIGMSPDETGKIFDKFYQIDSSNTRKAGGSGLGLAIIKGIIEGQGGTISVESQPGKGSTFMFTVRRWDE
jgi:signal transduction histidine kinase